MYVIYTRLPSFRKTDDFNDPLCSVARVLRLGVLFMLLPSVWSQFCPPCLRPLRCHEYNGVDGSLESSFRNTCSCSPPTHMHMQPLAAPTLVCLAHFLLHWLCILYPPAMMFLMYHCVFSMDCFRVLFVVSLLIVVLHPPFSIFWSVFCTLSGLGSCPVRESSFGCWKHLRKRR